MRDVFKSGVMKWLILFFMGVSAGFAVFMFAAHTASAVSLPSSPWLNAPVEVVSRALGADSGVSSSCSGYDQSIQVTGRDYTNTACVYGDFGEFRVASYSNGQGATVLAVAYPFDLQFYELRGWCVSIAKCAYSSKSDTFVAPYGRSVGFHKNFSQHLERRLDPNTQLTYFEYVNTAEPAVVVRQNYSVDVGAVAFSNNGLWAVVEVHSFGFLRVDLTTYSMRRIVAPGADYGVGNDPFYELAVSNSGRHVAVTGFRGGLSVYEVDSDCGDFLQDDSGKRFALEVNPCKAASLNAWSLFSGFQYGSRPSFDASGTRLRATIFSSIIDLPEKVVLATEGTASNEPLQYLALGDSFTSGEGETEDRYYRQLASSSTSPCHLGSRSYPFLLAHSWGVREMQSVACSGATTNDVFGTTEYFGQGDRSAALMTTVQDRLQLEDFSIHTFQPGIVRQVDFVTHFMPSLVSIGIGGNDAGLISKLKVCLGTDTCEWATDVQKRVATAEELRATYEKLKGAIQAIKTASPQSRILVVGYPRVINEAPQASCGTLVGSLLNANERRFMDESIKYLNSILMTAAESEGVLYADIEDAFNGHRLCDAKQDAMNGLRLGEDIAPLDSLPLLKIIGSESFHPTPIGHELVTQAIVSAYVDAPEPENCDDCGHEMPPPLPSGYWIPSVQNQERKYRQVETRIVQDKVYAPGDVFEISTPAHLFAAAVAENEVTVAIHSEPITIGKVTAQESGQVKATVALPTHLSEGFHTIHLYGIAPSGEPVDIYQVIAVQVYADERVSSGGTGTAVDDAVISEAPTNTVSPFLEASGNSVQFADSAGILGALSNFTATQGIGGVVPRVSDLPSSSAAKDTVGTHVWTFAVLGILIGALLFIAPFVVYRLLRIYRTRHKPD